MELLEHNAIAVLVKAIDALDGAISYGDTSPCETAGSADGVMVLGWHDSRLQVLRQVVRCDHVQSARAYSGAPRVHGRRHLEA